MVDGDTDTERLGERLLDTGVAVFDGVCDGVTARVAAHEEPVSNWPTGQIQQLAVPPFPQPALTVRYSFVNDPPHGKFDHHVELSAVQLPGHLACTTKPLQFTFVAEPPPGG